MSTTSKCPQMPQHTRKIKWGGDDDRETHINSDLSLTADKRTHSKLKLLCLKICLDIV